VISKSALLPGCRVVSFDHPIAQSQGCIHAREIVLGLPARTSSRDKNYTQALYMPRRAVAQLPYGAHQRAWSETEARFILGRS
jgi:hypothetical protein